jgi:hypothetical protein
LIVQRSVIDPATGQAALLLLSRATDWGHQLQEITYLVDRTEPSGVVQRAILPTTYRFIFRHEMQLLVKAGGFDLQEVYGSYDLEPFDTGSEKIIVVATPA